MPVFGFSYKTDTSAETIGRITCESMETAVELLAEIKRLPKSEVMQLFNITNLEQTNENDIFSHSC